MGSIHDEKYYYLNNKYNMLINLKEFKYMVMVGTQMLNYNLGHLKIMLLTNVTSVSSV